MLKSRFRKTKLLAMLLIVVMAMTSYNITYAEPTLGVETGSGNEGGETEPETGGETEPGSDSETEPGADGETEPEVDGETEPGTDGETNASVLEENAYNVVKSLFIDRVSDEDILNSCYEIIDEMDIESVQNFLLEVQDNPWFIDEIIEIATVMVQGSDMEEGYDEGSGYVYVPDDNEESEEGNFRTFGFYSMNDSLDPPWYSEQTGTSDEIIKSFTKSAEALSDKFREYQINITFTIDAKTIEKSAKPIDVLVVQDISGSMAGTRLTNAKDSLNALVDEILKPGTDNRIAITTFSDKIRDQVAYTAYKPSTTYNNVTTYELDDSGTYLYGNYEKSTNSSATYAYITAGSYYRVNSGGAYSLSGNTVTYVQNANGAYAKTEGTRSGFIFNYTYFLYEYVGPNNGGTYRRTGSEAYSNTGGNATTYVYKQTSCTQTQYNARSTTYYLLPTGEIANTAAGVPSANRFSQIQPNTYYPVTSGGTYNLANANGFYNTGTYALANATTYGAFRYYSAAGYYVVGTALGTHKQVITPVLDETKANEGIKDTISKFSAIGGTNSQLGMMTGHDYVNTNANPDAEKVILFISDGVPTYRQTDIYAGTTTALSGTTETYASATYAQAWNANMDGKIKVGARWKNFIYKDTNTSFRAYNMITGVADTISGTTLDDTLSHSSSSTPRETNLILEGQYAAGRGIHVYTIACDNTVTDLLKYMTYAMPQEEASKSPSEVNRGYTAIVSEKTRAYTATDKTALINAIKEISKDITETQKGNGVLLNDTLNTNVFQYNGDASITGVLKDGTAPILDAPSYADGKISWNGGALEPGTYTLTFTVEATGLAEGGKIVNTNNGKATVSYNESNTGTTITHNVDSPVQDVPPLFSVGLTVDKLAVWKGSHATLTPSLTIPSDLETYNMPTEWKNYYNADNFSYSLFNTSEPQVSLSSNPDGYPANNLANGVHTFQFEAKMKGTGFSNTSEPVSFCVVAGKLMVKATGADNGDKIDIQTNMTNGFFHTAAVVGGSGTTYAVTVDNTFTGKSHVPYGYAYTVSSPVTYHLSNSLNAWMAANSDANINKLYTDLTAEFTKTITVTVSKANKPYFRDWAFN